MSQETIDLMRTGYEAFARFDIPFLFKFLHPDVEYYQTGQVPWGGTYRGRQGMLKLFAKMYSYISSRFEPGEFVVAGDHVVVVGRTRGRARSSGKEFDLRVVHVWTIKDGKALRLEAYVDTPKMLAALAG